MSFLNPEFFWLLLIIVFMTIKKDFRNFSLTSYGYIVTLIFIIIALSRPVIEQKPIKSEEVLNDVIVAVDLSYSMQAKDLNPNRLAYAKEKLTQLVKKERKTRFGVLGFTTNAIVLSPLTQDSELLLHLFNSLDDSLILTKGSSVMPALELARKMSKSKNPSVVILSDGGDSISYEREAIYAKQNGLIVNVLMLATPIGSTLRLQNGELLKEENGDIVVSRENDTISIIAKESGGVYTKSLDDIVSALRSQRDEEFTSKSVIMKNLELFYIFIALAILTFIISVTTLKYKIVKIAVAFLLLFGVNLEASVFDNWYESSAKTAYEKQEFEKAIDFYKKIQKNRAYFNLANSYYKNGDYEKALVNFKKVKSSDSKFKSEVFYNMGNTLVRLKEFKKARAAYLKSLTLFYTKEADENFRYIKDVGEQMTMKTGQQKSKKKSSTAKEEDSTAKKKKDGGGSNMKVDASGGSGDAKDGKKTKSETKLNLNSGKAKLSSKQYELINKRGINEKKPW